MRKYSIHLIAVLLVLWATSATALTLEQAIALGRERSLQLRGPQIDRLKIDGQIKEAWSNALPQVQGQAGLQQAWKENMSFLPDFSDLASGRFMKIKMQPDNAIGADVTLTQPIYTDEAMANLKRAKEALQSAVLAGIMPVVSYKNALFLNNEVAGITIPESLIRSLENADKIEAAEIAANACIEIANRVHDYCDGYYIITPLKRVDIIKKIIEGLS